MLIIYHKAENIKMMTNLKQVFCILLILLNSFTTLLGQGDLGAGFNPEANVPASPEAASLGKYGDIPVSNYSGIPSIDIPLYTVQSKEVSVPISMSYFSNGIAVTEEAGWMGLAWTLNAGGVISRTIRGKDDFGYSQNCSNYIPYYGNQQNIPNYPARPFTIRNWKAISSDHSTLESNNCNTSYNCTGFDEDSSPNEVVNGLLDQFWFQTNKEEWTNPALEQYESYDSDFFCTSGPTKDLEPDLFHFNFLGLSGKFVIDRAGNCIPLAMQDIKIEITGTAPAYSWTITTNDGMKYYFGHSLTSIQVTGSRSTTYTENNLNPQNPNSTTNSCGPALWEEHVSSWYLDKIESVNGDVVELLYEKGQGHIFPIPSYTEVAKDLVLAGYDEADSAPCFAIRPTGAGSSVWHRTITDTRYESVYLKSIVHNFGKVDFNGVAGRTDLLGAQTLESIEIYQKKSSSATEIPLKKYKFNYEYFTSPYAPANNRWNVGYTNYEDGIYLSEGRVNTRLKLKSIEDRGNDFNVLPDIPPYEFFYDETVKLPSKTSMSIDHWGYANGPDLLNYNQSLMPSWEGYQRTSPASFSRYLYYSIPGADRNPNANYTGAFLLNEIKYPTGGFTKLNYEANRYRNLKDPYQAQEKIATTTLLPGSGGTVSPSTFSVSSTQKYPVSFAAIHINWEMFGDLEQGVCHSNGSTNMVRADLTHGIGFEAVLRHTSNNNLVVKSWSYDSDEFVRNGNSFTFSSNEYVNLQPGGD
ncbi:MAG: hypothetical protein AB8G15_18665, partial [Saprospiraceae bacterium]